jgi:hypothetical protein
VSGSHSTSAPLISRRTLLAAVAVVALAPLLFAWFSGQIWEDYYITFRSSRNLAEGHGLVYQPGERVHTFTSPLGVLLPALSFVLAGDDQPALWLFRVLSALALAGAAGLVFRHASEQGWSAAGAWFALCLGLLEAKIVAFSANGMETAILVLFAALAWHELTRPAGMRVVWLALAYAGLMWTRPDACVLAAAMTFSWWLFGAPKSMPDRARFWPRLAGAILLGGLIYAPWLLWAWDYYGSFVPQTIIAKSALTPGGLSLSRIILAPLHCLVSRTALDGLFTPIYASNGWPPFFLLAGAGLARLAAFLWVVPVLSRATRAASFGVLLGGIYFHQIMPYPWYYAPWTMLAALALAGGAWALAIRLPAFCRPLGRIIAASLAGGTLLVSVAQAYSAKQQQQIIEDTGRKKIGVWLRNHAARGDSVFLEPIGYIGYFSQLKILDFPGLSAPEVSAIVRSGPGGYARIITTLKPDWLVLRPYEIAHQNLQDSGMLSNYEPVLYSNRRPALDACNFLPGRNWLEFDAEFFVFHRKDSSVTPLRLTPADMPDGRRN